MYGIGRRDKLKCTCVYCVCKKQEGMSGVAAVEPLGEGLIGVGVC